MFIISRKKALAFFMISLVAGLAMFGLVTSSASEQEITLLHVTYGGSPAKGPDPAIDPPEVRKYAVVIGIVYDNSDLGVVNYADQDALSVYNLLTGKMGFPRNQVMMLRNGEANIQGMNKALLWLTTRPGIDDADVVFYYSGHGVRSAAAAAPDYDGKAPGYALVPYDFAGYDYAHGQGLVWDDYLASMLGKISPKRMWIAIDACVAGGFTRPGITGQNRVLTLSSQSDQLSGEVSETGRGVLTQYMIEDGVARGVPVEKAFAASVSRAFDGYGQAPLIVDDYPGDLDLFH